MTRLFQCMAVIWFVATSAAVAGERLVVVELFTSQGCSSCPPADAFFRENLSGRDDVIALALHVDYWDYIGWKDKFADPDYTLRQKAYATASGRRSVYTPQMIVGGQDHVVGNHPKEVHSLIDAHKQVASPVSLSMVKKGNRVSISADAMSDVGPMVVYLVRYQLLKSVKIKRGENAGRTLTYANIVDDWDVVATWDGRKPLSLQKTVRGDAPIVAIVQTKGHGRILAAARIGN